MSQPRERSNRPLLIIIVILLLALVCGGAVPVVGILAAIAIPNFIQMQLRAKRAELPVNVDGIRIAEIAYEAAFDTFLAVPEPTPVPAWRVDGQLHPWERGTAFEDLGWEPSGEVRGAYWVEVNAEEYDFTVYGVCDMDNDGDVATYTATREQRATMQTYHSTY